MNRESMPEDGSVLFYDGDYPSAEAAAQPGFDPALPDRQLIRYDVAFYRRTAAATAGTVVEIGCGTGRITLPLARDGHSVVAVDVNAAMLERLRQAMARAPASVAARIRPVLADALSLSLTAEPIGCIVAPFNTFMLLGGFREQCRALEVFAAHLPPAGRLAFDLMNPLVLPLGESAADAPAQRRDPATGRLYRKFAHTDRIDTEHRQRLFGWYEEVLEDGTVRTHPYAFVWRPVFRHELELMLERAGFRLDRLDGGFQDEPFRVDSAKMVVTATKI